MENGQIKRLTDRGYGFIQPANGGDDIFFHQSNLIDATFDSLKEGDNVTYEVENSDKGLNALSVKKV